ncbi:MAG: hypothetical protein WC394_03555 [Candidatus Omnitrophota bacterium]|jgi:hypothetical protein
MKTKTLYAIVFILAVIIMLALIYGKSKIAELNQPALKESQVEVKEPEAITQSPEPVFFHKEAVTIIKPAQGKQSAVSEIDKVEDIKDQQDSDLSLQNTSAEGGRTNGQDTEEAAGVTRLGDKYPTKEEVKEMNSKGIVMY